MANSLTQTELDLIRGLMIFGVEREAIIGIMIALKDEDSQWQMIDFMVEHQQATQEDILEELVRIIKNR